MDEWTRVRLEACRMGRVACSKHLTELKKPWYVKLKDRLFKKRNT